jgi:N-methylhydantoinase B
MNNLAFGGLDNIRGRPFAYYETIAGGMGASPAANGTSAVHTHMTNSWNTPAEAIEHQYPVRVRGYHIRRGSGGAGRHAGGDGIVREYEFLAPASVTLLSDRRERGPWGLAGGKAGLPGRGSLLRGRRAEPLAGKVQVAAEPGDILRLETPGGGGWGTR